MSGESGHCRRKLYERYKESDWRHGREGVSKGMGLICS